MFLNPELRALRDDATPQRVAQQTLHRSVQRWREAVGGDVLDAEMERFAAGASLEALPLLAALFDGEDTTAREFADSLIEKSCAALREEPLGMMTQRHFTDGTLSMLLLARSGSATLALVAVDGLALAKNPTPKSVSFPPNDSWEHVLAGCAIAEKIDSLSDGPRSVRLETAPMTLGRGSVIVRDSSREALRLAEVDGCLVTLRLQRRKPGSAVTREYRLEDGALLHQAASNPRDSRFELAAALLSRMGREDAAPLLAAIAQEPGSSGLRWQVLRECLALSTGEGFAALSAIAGSGEDPLSAPAGALRAQLVERHPVLAEIEPCPA